LGVRAPSWSRLACAKTKSRLAGEEIKGREDNKETERDVLKKTLYFCRHVGKKKSQPDRAWEYLVKGENSETGKLWNGTRQIGVRPSVRTNFN